ncbi:aminotransferase class I/II-fold pyridoxal phosphate-dependent enzyme [Epibacterium sp. SM1979]|uniref:Aminotransferase class I/II-fold pyridoxal phosphate-dependent enzyme n=1 Tax=Tritonibacter litoralis TaxID=2662264 RepID=A0A843YI02_9RHOB|nr:PLP-dependent aminotransferase family protein [Tritonibacter litoralis]MQQ09064.1 aminotransferase class I/II-fold pyridoxal phosphate-dependent enzyme [Tritonibacter litoralis]
MAIPPEIFLLPPGGEGTLQQKIQQVVSESIVSGRCVVGERMPSTRRLAEHLNVARITVTLAYNELVANEYLTSRGRSGYYVADTAPKRPTFDPLATEAQEKVQWGKKFNQKFSAHFEISRPPNWRDYRYPFIYGQSDADLFDHRNWRACALRAVGRRDFDTLATDHYQRDDPMLVEFILRQILPRRGIAAQPQEILITMGSQNALWLVVELLLNRRRKAVIENPGYPGLRQILAPKRCAVEAIDVDHDGLPPDLIPQDADLVFTTPSHHCPTNVTMSLARRQALLDRAARDDFVIVEDDYEFELSFLKSPSPALKSLDQAGAVIYVGSFSKSVFPGLRLGYMVAPEEVIDEARALRSAVLRHPPSHVQRTAAYFLSLGHFDAQLARQSRSFSRRRTVMEACLRKHGLLNSQRGDFGGSSFWLRAPDGVDTSQLAYDLRKDSVLIEPGAAFFAPEKPDRRHYRLAYSSIPSGRIEAGIDLMAERMAATL